MNIRFDYDPDYKAAEPPRTAPIGANVTERQLRTCRSAMLRLRTALYANATGCYVQLRDRWTDTDETAKSRDFAALGG